MDKPKTLGEFSRGGEDYLVEHSEKAGQTRVVRLTQTRLDRFFRRGLLSKKEKENRRLYDAGNRYRIDWTTAGLEPNLVSSYTDLVSSGSIQGFSNARIDAYRRWQEATRCLGPLADITVRVCCFDEVAGGSFGMDKLRAGLKRLAKNYGY